MIRTIIMTVPDQEGHMLPTLCIAKGLVQRGYRVLVHSHERSESRVRSVGAEHLPFGDYRDVFSRVLADQTPPPAWLPKKAVGFWRFRRCLVEGSIALAQTLVPLLTRERAVLLIADYMAFGASYAAELTGLPHVSLAASGVAAFTAEGRLVLGAPPAIMLTRVLPRAPLFTLVDRLLPLRWARRALGLPIRHTGQPEFFAQMASTRCHLVVGPRWFVPEGPLWPGQEFIGPALFDAPIGEGQRPLGESLPKGTVLISTTTNGLGLDQGLLSRVLPALAPLGISILATNPGNDPLPSGLGSHVRIERFVPHDQVLPYVRALITHGGWGTVSRALKAALPMLVIPISGDQIIIGRRLADLGLAHHLPLSQASPERIRARFLAMLDDAPLRERLRQRSVDLQQLDASKLAADAVHRLLDATHPNAEKISP
jgi:MGT family glycosyltransferase